MPIRLPFDQTARGPLRQIGARITAPLLARYSSALVFLPLAPSEADWRVLPHGAVAARPVRAERCARAGDCFHLRGGSARADAVDRRMPGRPSQLTFEAACKAAGKARAQRLGTVNRNRCCCGSRAAPKIRRMRTLSATIRGAFRRPRSRFASFKSKPKSARAGWRASTSHRRKNYPDLDLALATAAGK